MRYRTFGGDGYTAGLIQKEREVEIESLKHTGMTTLAATRRSSCLNSVKNCPPILEILARRLAWRSFASQKR